MKVEIKIPESVEDFGRWLEQRNATVEIRCMLGTYHVLITCHEPQGNTENRQVSVSRSSSLDVIGYSKNFQEAVFNAMRAVEDELRR